MNPTQPARVAAAPGARSVLSGMDGYVLPGMMAASVSVLVFTAVHHVLISNIWFSLPMMLGAAALTGAALAWNYRVLSEEPSLPSWVAYNAACVAALFLLAVASMVVFEPIVTMEELLASSGPPSELFGRALPLTLLFALGTAVAITAIWGWTWPRFSTTVVSVIALSLLLGLNISTLGLVEIAGDSAYIVAEFFALVVLLDIVYTVAFAAVARRTLWRSPSV